MTNGVRWLRGGELGDGEAVVTGPAFKRGYSTPALGWADDIHVAAHEIAACVLRGGLYTFSGYLVGTRESVTRCLRAAMAGEAQPPVPFAGSWRDLVDAAAYGARAARALGIEV